MSPRKLTAADKKAIVSTYRSSGESTTALADRYGVSTSTISRLLKNNIPEEEYELLISERRTQRGEDGEDILVDPQAVLEDDPINTAILEELPSEVPRLRITTNPTGTRRVRRRSSAIEEEENLEQSNKTSSLRPITRAQKYSIDAPFDALNTFDQFSEQFTTSDREENIEASPVILPPIIAPVIPSVSSSYFDQTPPKSPAPKVIIQRSVSSPRLASEAALDSPESTAYGVSEGVDDLQEDLSRVASLFGEDMSDMLDDEDDDLPEEEGWTERLIPALIAPEMQVLPFASATLPRTCYIVVDKFAELVACPLRDFVELGKVNDDSPQNTLPVFDNQRVAKRFSNNRNQRVIKVPDSGVFYKTIDHLLAKGISLMLVDGRIYSLR